MYKFDIFFNFLDKFLLKSTSGMEIEGKDDKKSKKEIEISEEEEPKISWKKWREIKRNLKPT